MVREAQSDLLFKQTILEGSDHPQDVLVRDGRVAAVTPHIDGGSPTTRVLDCTGMFLSPPLIDPHQHLDCAYMLDEENESGTLEEAVELFIRVKPRRSQQTVKALAERAVREALCNGVTFIRSQVDVDSIAGMKHLEAVLELKAAYLGIVDIQIVACMEYPLATEPEAALWLSRAIEAGANLVGGIPEVEPDLEAKRRHVQMVFDVARRYSVDIDMHIDETSDPNCRTLELLADATLQHGYQGHVAAGHCCALSVYDLDYAQKVIEKVALAQIHVITNPLTNLYIQGRGSGTPTWRGITRVKELLAAGVNVSCALDDNSNFFLPFGKMNMLEVALFTSLAAQMTTPEQLQTVFDMPRGRAACILGLQEYGFSVGKPADFIVLPVGSILDAIRLAPAPRYVVRRGKIVAESRLEQVTWRPIKF